MLLCLQKQSLEWWILTSRFPEVDVKSSWGYLPMRMSSALQTCFAPQGPHALQRICSWAALPSCQQPWSQRTSVPTDRGASNCSSDTSRSFATWPERQCLGVPLRVPQNHQNLENHGKPVVWSTTV